MTAVCFYFQVHQPFRLRRYSVFSNDPFYFDNDANREIMEKVTEKCYRPTTSLLLDRAIRPLQLIEHHLGPLQRVQRLLGLTGLLRVP